MSVPTSIEGLEHAARKLTKDNDGDGHPEVYGFSWTMGERRWVAKHLSQLLFGHGYRFLNENFTGVHPALKDDKAADLMAFMRRLYQDGLTPNPLGWKYQDNVVAMQQGKLALTWEDSVRVLLVEDPSQSSVVGKMGYSVVPHADWGPEPVAYEGGGHALGIPKDISKEKKEAVWEFVKFMVSYDAQREMAINRSNGPSMLRIFETPEYDNPAKAAIGEALGSGVRFVLPVPKVEEIQRDIEQDVHNFMLGKMSPEDLVDRMYRTLDRNVR